MVKLDAELQHRLMMLEEQARSQTELAEQQVRLLGSIEALLADDIVAATAVCGQQYLGPPTSGFDIFNCARHAGHEGDHLGRPVPTVEGVSAGPGPRLVHDVERGPRATKVAEAPPPPNTESCWAMHPASGGVPYVCRLGKAHHGPHVAADGFHWAVEP